MVGVTVGALAAGADRLVGAAPPGPRRRRRHASRPRHRRSAQRWAKGGVLRETFHNSHALLAFFALSNADVIIARTTLDEHQAGLYAGGLILTKAVLFLPQFVVVIAFPSMSRAGDDRRAHLVSLGAGARHRRGRRRSGVAVLSALAVVFVGGPEYADLQGRLWGFAVLGTLLSLIQVMVYEVVARQHQRMVLVVWATLAGAAVRRPVRRRADRPADRRRCTLDALLFMVLLVVSLRSRTVLAESAAVSRPTRPARSCRGRPCRRRARAARCWCRPAGPGGPGARARPAGPRRAARH